MLVCVNSVGERQDMTEKLLLINDLAGYGKVALGAMMPVLTHMGFDLYTLPTALVSNTLDYGSFEILDTTDYIEGTLRVWDELGFSFDAVATGFITGERQAKLIASFCAKQQEKGVPVFVDPIMGDEGRLYNGVGREAIIHMRELLASSDVAVPNYTEACLLTGAPYAGAQGMSKQEARRLMDFLRTICPKSVIITSAAIDRHPAVIGYDHERDEHFTIRFEEIPVRFPGTGDIFSSMLMGKKLLGLTLEDATACAMHVVKDLIRLNQNAPDTFKGIPVERYLSKLTR